MSWKNVERDEEAGDYGRRRGRSAAIIGRDGQPLIRHAVVTDAYVQVSPPVWGPEEKVYVTSPGEVPGWLDGDDDAPEGVLGDEHGFYYLRRPLISPGVERRKTPDERQADDEAAEAALDEWLAMIVEAADRLRGR